MSTNFVAASVRLPRITVVSVLDELKLDTPSAARLPYLYDCYGVVNSVKHGHDGKGPWTRFDGKFVAVTADGVEFHSKRCHVPATGQASICERWSDATAVDPDAQLQIAVRVKLSMSGKIIVFDAEQLMPPEPFNEVRAVRERVDRYRVGRAVAE